MKGWKWSGSLNSGQALKEIDAAGDVGEVNEEGDRGAGESDEIGTPGNPRFDHSGSAAGGRLTLGIDAPMSVGPETEHGTLLDVQIDKANVQVYPLTGTPKRQTVVITQPAGVLPGDGAILMVRLDIDAETSFRLFST